MAEKSGGLMAQQIAGQRPIRSKALNNMRLALMTPTADLNLDAELQGMSDAQRQQILSMATMIRMGGNDGRSWAKVVRSMYPSMDTRQAQIIAAVLQDTSPVDPASITPDVEPQVPSNQWAMMQPVEAMLGIEPYTYTKPPRDMPLVDRKSQPNAATPPNTDPFVDRLKQSESSGKLSAEYQTKDGQTYSGLYQFGAARLADYKSASGDRFTQDEFKQDAALQEKIMAWHLSDIDQAIVGLGDKAQGYNKDGLRAVAHLGGKSGMAKYVKSGGTYDPSDELGTSLSDYYAKFSAKADQQA